MQAKLLFINSSRRSLNFYQIFEDYYGKGLASILSGPKIDRVISDLKDPDFFSIGLKNLVQNSNAESYQIKSGPSAQNAISLTDGRMYKRGHLMGRGADATGKRVTIGYSSSSKVWSNNTARVGELIEWCQSLALKLQTAGTVKTGTPLDNLEIGDELKKLPPGVIGVGWPEHIFKASPRIRMIYLGERFECSLLDCELALDRKNTTDQVWSVRLAHDFGGEILLRFTLVDGRHAFASASVGREVDVILEDEDVRITDYLRHHPLAFFLEDFSRVDGSTLSKYHSTEKSLSEQQLRSFSWMEDGIDIQMECSEAGLSLQQPKSVQDRLGVELMKGDAGIVFFDHGSGEMADFITVSQRDNSVVKVALYHCKGSGGKKPGDRVDDAYEVCGQVAKSLVWLKNKQELRQKILDREIKRGGTSRFLKGSRNSLLRVLADEIPVKLEFDIHVVQPGIPIGSISERVGQVLAAASHYIQRACGATMYLIGSA